MVDGASSVTLVGGNVAINPGAASSQSSSVSVNPPRAFSMSPLASTKPVMTSAAYSAMVEDGALMKELCQCGKGGVCQLHN